MTTIEPWLREILRCPVGQHELIDAVGPTGESELQCATNCGKLGCRRAYRVDNGIPVLLVDDSRVATN